MRVGFVSSFVGCFFVVVVVVVVLLLLRLCCCGWLVSCFAVAVSLAPKPFYLTRPIECLAPPDLSIHIQKHSRIAVAVAPPPPSLKMQKEDRKPMDEKVHNALLGQQQHQEQTPTVTDVERLIEVLEQVVQHGGVALTPRSSLRLAGMCAGVKMYDRAMPLFDAAVSRVSNPCFFFVFSAHARGVPQ